MLVDADNHSLLDNPRVVNSSAAKRILKADPLSNPVNCYWVLRKHPPHGVWVQPSGCDHEVFIPFKDFVSDFISYRKSGSLTCHVIGEEPTHYGTLYWVEGTTGTYQVERSRLTGNYSCNCEDWWQHCHLCKHCYAVIRKCGQPTRKTA